MQARTFKKRSFEKNGYETGAERQKSKFSLQLKCHQYEAWPLIFRVLFSFGEAILY